MKQYYDEFVGKLVNNGFQDVHFSERDFNVYCSAPNGKKVVISLYPERLNKYELLKVRDSILRDYDEWMCFTNRDYFKLVGEAVGYKFCICGEKQFSSWVEWMSKTGDIALE